MKYEIGNKVFCLKKLVLVQTRHLMKELSSLGVARIEGEELMKKILDITGDGMPRILSCILIEEGKIFPRTDEEFEEVVSFIDNNVDVDVVMEIMKDFLVLSQPVKTSLSFEEKDKVVPSDPVRI